MASGEQTDVGKLADMILAVGLAIGGRVDVGAASVDWIL